MNYDLQIDKENQTIKVKVTCFLTQEIRKDILIVVAGQLVTSGFAKI